MELMECFKKRRSVRSFTTDEVPDEVIEGALTVANLAPSAGNMQARDFVVVRDADTREKLTAATHEQNHIAEAPVVIVCCANLDRIVHYGPRGKNLFCLQDVAASVENMLLYIAMKGYGTCWIGAFDERLVSAILGLPVHVRPVTMVAVGMPDKVGEKPARMRTAGLVHYERW